MKLVYFLVLIKIMDCIKSTDFCHKTSINNKCYDKVHNFNCGHDLCSADVKSCQSIIIFSKMTLTKEGFQKERFKSFKNQIKNCPEPPKYEWSASDVCLNTKDCKKPSYLKRWSSHKCKCTGKYSYNCNNDYCASDKRACKGLKSKQLSKIAKCKKY